MKELEHEMLRGPRFSMGSPAYAEIADVMLKIGEPALPGLAVGLIHWREFGPTFCVQSLLASAESAVPLVPIIVSAWRCGGDDVRRPGVDPRWESTRERYDEDWSGPSNTNGLASLGVGALPDTGAHSGRSALPGEDEGGRESGGLRGSCSSRARQSSQVARG